MTIEIPNEKMKNIFMSNDNTYNYELTCGMINESIYDIITNGLVEERQLVHFDVYSTASYVTNHYLPNPNPKKSGQGNELTYGLMEVNLETAQEDIRNSINQLEVLLRTNSSPMKST